MDTLKARQIRYEFETLLLPTFFFKHKTDFTTILIQNKTVLYRILNDFFKENKTENPYKREEFDVYVSKITEEVLMLKLVLPPPEAEPLCYAIYLFFDAAFEKVSYFCVEKSDKDDYAFICEWTKGNLHGNFGMCKLENNADFVRCAEIHMKRYYNMVLSKDEIINNASDNTKKDEE